MKKVLIFLEFMACSEQYRKCGYTYDVSPSTAHAIVQEVMEAVLSHMLSKYVRWPGHSRQQEVARSYLLMYGFPGVIGCIDATHFEINRPQFNQGDYCGRFKPKHTMILQATCGPNSAFTSVFAGIPGRCHDGSVFSRSPLCLGEDERLDNLFVDEHHHIVGDSAYPLKSYLMKPYRRLRGLNTTPAQLNFNRGLSKCRIDIERAFGVLKGRWRRLSSINVKHPMKAARLITAACVLHNFGILHGDDWPDTEEDLPQYEEDDAGPDQYRTWGIDARAVLKRDNIKDVLPQYN